MYIICNIFYFIYKFKFFPWKSLNKTYIRYWVNFFSYRLEDNKKIFYDANSPLATFLICYSKEDTLFDAIKIAEEYLRNIDSKEKVNAELIIIALKQIYFSKSN
jgi:hypothetical protein